MTEMLNDEETTVWETVKAMNRLWTLQRAPEQLDRYFHQDMIALCANDPERKVGGAACVKGWSDFVDKVCDLSICETDPLIRMHLGGRAAVVTYNYDCLFTMNGTKVHAEGRDMFFLVKEGGRWQAAADHFSPMPRTVADPTNAG
jgi:hypothetical protein